ncbi:MAG: MjaI family restriction endonuclease [Ruminococcus sp.]|nr:MjaI family restriction endonuclease [Ruminococcus sp.]
MPKAQKEFILNNATNRWKLNSKNNVGPTSDSIRICQPHSIDEWANYYYSNVRSREHIDSLGEKLFEKITTVLPDEERFHPNLLESITLDDCIEYMHTLVIDRTYNGYLKEHGE